MPGGSTTSQNQNQSVASNSTTAPWAPAQPLLTGIINQLGSTNAGVTPQQSSAARSLYDATTGLPNFSGQGTNLADSLFGYSTAPAQTELANSYDKYSGSLSPYLSSSYLNPYNTPGFSDALKTMNSDISNQVNDQFAAAGRDLSPGNTTALARGLSQGEGGLLAQQFNTNVGTQLGAAGSEFGAGTSLAQGITAQQQAEQAAQQAGLGVAGAVPQLATAPGQAQLGAANTGAQLPFQNLGWLSSLTLPLGAMGGTTSGTQFGTGTGTTTQQTSPISNMLSAGVGGLGLLSGTGAFGDSGYLNPSSKSFVFSDERVKDDISPVGMLFDGQPVYSYHYKGDDTPQIGLLAQEVEEVRPDAVVEFGPARIKAVDYGKATERARHIGMLHDLDLAA